MSDYFSREGITREAGGSARQRAANIRLQPLGEEIKYPLTGGAMAQVLMHHQPYRDTEKKSAASTRCRGNNAVGEGRLADADPLPRRGSGSAGRGRYRCASRRPRAENGDSAQEPGERGGGAVETNQRVAVKLLRRSGPTTAGQIGIGSMQPKLDPAETPRDKLLLLRSDHPHCDVRLPVKQILKPIGEH